MKIQKNKKIILSVIFLILCLIWIFNTDRYLRSNIINVDKADEVEIFYKDKNLSYAFEDDLIDLLSYGGSVVKVDNFFKDNFAPYSRNLEKVDMYIIYKKAGKELTRSQVYKSDKKADQYILYMNKVYWITHSDFDELINLIN